MAIQFLNNSTFTGDVSLLDNEKLKIGTGGDIQIFHDSSSSFIDAYNQNLNIRSLTADKDIVFEADNGAGGLTQYYRIDGGARLNVFSKDVFLADNVKSLYGSSSDLKIYHDGSNSYIDDAGTGDLYIRANNLRLSNADGSGQFINANNGGAVELYHNNNKRFETTAGGTSNTGTIDSTGTITVTGANGNVGINTDTGKLLLGASYDLQIYHDGSNSYIDNQTGNLFIVNKANDKDIRFQTDNGSGGTTTYFTIDGLNGINQFSKNVSLPDNVIAKFGNSSDLQIYHDNSNSYIQDTGTGNLLITSGGASVQINKGTTENMAEFITDGAVKLYYNSVKKFETTSTGVEVAGKISGVTAGTANTDAVNFQQLTDAVTGVLVYQGVWDASGTGGGSPDLTAGDRKVPGYYWIVNVDGQAAPNGTGTTPNEWVTGDWCVFSDQDTDAWQKIDNTNILTGAGTGGTVSGWAGSGTSVTLGNTPLTFSGTSLTTGGDTTLGGNLQSSLGNISFGDSTSAGVGRARFGVGSDLQIYHDGSNSYIDETGTGDLIIKGGNDILFQDAAGNTLANMNQSNSVELYFGNSKKFETTSTGVLVSSNLTFNGSSLISSNTADGSDNAQIIISGGGASGDTRGASVHISGNESGNAGLLQLRAGSGSVSQIRSYTSGSERMRIDASGNVGIGTTNPSLQLHIKSTSGDTRGLMIEKTVTTSYAELAVKAAREFRIGTGGSATGANAASAFYVYDATAGGTAGHRFEISSDGDVQARRPRSNTAGDVALSLQPTDSTIHYGFRIDQTTNSLNLDRVDSAAQLLRIDTSGNATFAGSIFLPDNRDIGWNGGYSAGKPTLAAVGTTIKMFPSGSVSGLQFSLTPTDATFAGDVVLADNKKLKFGAGPDFEIYHNSTTNVNHISSLLSRQLSINSDSTTFSGSATIRKSALGGSTPMADGTLVLGAGSTNYFSLRLDSGADLYLDKSYGGVAANVFSIDRSTTNGNITFSGDVTIGSSGASSDKTLNILTGGSKSIVKLMEAGTVYGFSTLYDGATNKFHINRHSNSAAGTAVISLNRDDGKVRFDAYGVEDFTGTAAYLLAVEADGDVIEIGASDIPGGPYLPLGGGTMTGATLHGDSVLSRYGADNDFSIYHDGTNGYLQNETGNLLIPSGKVGIGNTSPDQKLDTPNIIIGGSSIAASYRANATLMDNLSGVARFYSLGPNTTTGGSYQFNSLSSNASAGSGALLTLANDGNATFAGGITVSGNTKLTSGTFQVSSDSSVSSAFSYTFRDAVGINNPNSVSAQAVAGFVMSVGRSISDGVGGGIHVQGESTFVRGITALTNSTFGGNIVFGDNHFIGNGSGDDLSIQSSTGEDIVLDASGDIVLDAGGDDIRLKVSGTEYAKFDNSSSNLNIYSSIQDKDIIFKGNDDGTAVTALTLDMSDAGAAEFGARLYIPDYIAHVGDSNTLFGFNGNDTFVVNTSGLERMRVNSSGNVGINTTNPSAKIDVVDSFGGASIRVAGTNTDSNAHYYGFMHDPVDLQGTTQVNTFYSGGAIKSSTTITDYAGIRIDTPNVSADAAVVTNNYGVYQSSSLQKNYFAGNIGIGTISPGAKLDVVVSDVNVTPNGNSSAVFRQNANNYITILSGTNNEGGLLFGNSGDAADGWIAYQNGSGNQFIGFGTANSEKMRITSAGNVGIGTSAPAYKLEISGGAISIKGNLPGNSLRFNSIVSGTATSRNALYVDFK